MKNNKISRRYFLQGSAALSGSLMLSACASQIYRPAQASNIAKTDYPPALTNLRGDHNGSQAAAHSTALQGKSYSLPGNASEHYDLVVIGGDRWRS